MIQMTQDLSRGIDRHDMVAWCGPKSNGQSAQAHNHQRGFTLVEVLVTLAILGVLLGMLLPAVQAARESARRMQCQNNLVQLILAVNSYEMAHGVYPAGTISSQRPIRSSTAVSHVSWIVPILPYLEQQNAYDHLDQSLSIYDAKNQPVRALGLSVLTCPTSSSRVSGYSGYAGVHHDVEAPIDTDNHGIFFLNSNVQYQDVSDGASQTLYLGEKISLLGDLGWVSGTRATLRNTGSQLNAIRTGGMRLPIPTKPPGVSEEDGSDNATSAATRQGIAPLTVGGFASDHPGGANFARGDGSVRLLSDGIATAVYQQLGHRSDGGLLDAEY